MTKEILITGQARLTPEASSNTLVRGGVFIMPQVDGANNIEVQGTKPASPHIGERPAANGEARKAPDHVSVRLARATGAFYKDAFDLMLNPLPQKNSQEALTHLVDSIPQDAHLLRPLYKEGITRVQQNLETNKAILTKHAEEHREKGGEASFLLSSMLQAKGQSGEEAARVASEILDGHGTYAEPTGGVPIVLVDAEGMGKLRAAGGLQEAAGGLFYRFKVGEDEVQFVIAEVANKDLKEGAADKAHLDQTVRHEGQHFLWYLLEDSGFARAPQGHPHEQKAFTLFRHEVGAHIVGEDTQQIDLKYSNDPDVQDVAVRMQELVQTCVTEGKNENLDPHAFLYPILSARNFEELERNLLAILPNVPHEKMNPEGTKHSNHKDIHSMTELAEKGQDGEEQASEKPEEVAEFYRQRTPAEFTVLFGPPPADPALLAVYNRLSRLLTRFDLAVYANRPDQFNRRLWEPVVNYANAAPTPALRADANRYLDVLHGLQMASFKERVDAIPATNPNRRYYEQTMNVGRLEAILARPDVQAALLQEGRELDISEQGGLRHLVELIDQQDINQGEFEYFIAEIDGLEVGRTVSAEAKLVLFERMLEKFISLMDNLPTEQYQEPRNIYASQNSESLLARAKVGFGRKRDGSYNEEYYNYLVQLQKQRQKMHELFRNIPNQDQYKQWVALEIGDVGLDFVYNEVAGVIDYIKLLEGLSWYVTATTSHEQHRILNDGEYQRINRDAETIFLQMQEQGILRASSGRMLTKKEALRAKRMGESAWGGMQRMGIAMGWGGSPTHSSQIYRPATQAGIQRSLYSAKFAEMGLMGYAPGRFLMDKTFEFAKQFTDEGFDPFGLLRSRYVDGVGGISEYTAWLNTWGAPDIQTNPSRSVAMTFTDIWFRRNAGTANEEQTTMLNVLHEIGQTWKHYYRHERGIAAPDTPTGFVGGKQFAEYITGNTPDHHNAHTYEFMANEILKQRLYISYLAQYDAMPTDLKEKLFRKIAVLKPHDMVSFFPKLLDDSIDPANRARDEAAWGRLHTKLMVNSMARINEDGRAMLTYNDTLKTIRDGRDPNTDVAYGGNIATARGAYTVEWNPIHATYTAAIAAAGGNPALITAAERVYANSLNALHKKWGMDFENFDRWEAQLQEELFVTRNNYDPNSIFDATLMAPWDRPGHPTGAWRATTGAEATRLVNARYEMRDRIFGPPANFAALTTDEQHEYRLLTKIIDLSVGDSRINAVTGNPEVVIDKKGKHQILQYASTPVAKTVSEAKIAYKVCLDDTPRISWRSTGEGGGGGGKGMILSMYGDQAAVNQGVSEHLGHLMLDPINKAEEHIAGLVHQFNIHYGMGDAQAMFKPLIAAFVEMVRENGWAKYTGKEIRDFLQKPNSKMEDYFKVKGYALDEIAIFKLLLGLANHHGIETEKEVVGQRLKEIFSERQHGHNHGDKWQTWKDVATEPRFAWKLINEGLFDSKGKGKSQFDKLVEMLGVGPGGRRKARSRKFIQMLLLFIPVSILKAILPDDVKKSL